MSHATNAVSPISFTYDYEVYWTVRATISNGKATYVMYPDYVYNHPLFVLLKAVVELLRNRDEDTGCEWSYVGAAWLDRWHLHREDDTLRITIRGRQDGRPSASDLTPSWFWSSEAAGEVRFQTTCDLWTFAEQVHRVAKQRWLPFEDHDPSMLTAGARRTPEYRALSEFLEEHMRDGQPPLGTK